MYHSTQMGKTNPFSNDVVKIVKPGKRSIGFQKTEKAITEEGQEVIASTNYKETVDKSEFVMIYIDGITALCDLNKSGQKALRVLLDLYRSNQVPRGADRIYVSYSSAQKDHGYRHSRNYWYIGISVLANAEIIRKDTEEPGWYYINPCFFFKGNRYKLIQEFLAVDS